MGNGFISANVGCAIESKRPYHLTEFFLHNVGGVFNDKLAGSKSIPNRADVNVPNPFAAVANIAGAASNTQAGTALDLQHGLMDNVTATAAARVTTTAFAHRSLRNVLVFEVAADFAATEAIGRAAEVTVGPSRCGGGSLRL